MTVSVLHSESGAEGLLHRQSVRVDADNVLASGESLHVDGIRVNAISPGVVPTEGYNTSLGMTAEQVGQFADQMATTIPLGRVGTTDEIAKAVVFLASDAASYITGVDLIVDGGMTAV